MIVATIILTVALTYAAVGLLFGVVFVTVGAARIDPAARGGPIAFRLLILPASAALWPYLALRWRRATREATS